MSQNAEENKENQTSQLTVEDDFESAQRHMKTRSMIRSRVMSLSSMAVSSEDGELDIIDSFSQEFLTSPKLKITEKNIKTLNFNDIPHERVLAAIDKFFAEEEYQAIMEKELRV